MQYFYIPDGHRRYARREGLLIAQAYELGYSVLRDEIIHPLCADSRVTRIGLFLLSALNVQRRSSQDLTELLKALDLFVPRLCTDCASIANVRVFGSRAAPQQSLMSTKKPYLDLYIGSDTEDEISGGPVDIFVRSGNGLRLSGAPRRLLGPYTELYSLPKLHPEVKWKDIEDITTRYEGRYILESDPPLFTLR